MNDPRGSVWRKWDLQVQPIKHEWFLDLEGNIESIEKSAKEYLKAAKKRDVRVIAITDVRGHEHSPPGVNSIPHFYSELSDSI
jgi:hypothetical protein